MQIVLMQYADDHSELFVINFYETLDYELMLNNIKTNYGEYWDKEIKQLVTKSLKRAIKNFKNFKTNNYIAYNENNPMEYFIFARP